jgi:hypothetical protein
MAINPPVTLVITTLSNQTQEIVTVTPPPPPGTTPLVYAVPPGTTLPLGPGTFVVPPIPDPVTVPPTPASSITVTIGASVTGLVYGDGTGFTFLTTVGGDPEPLTRSALPNNITLQFAADATPGTITANGIVPIYALSLI